MKEEILSNLYLSFEPDNEDDSSEETPESDWDIETDNDPMEKSGTGDDEDRIEK